MDYFDFELRIGASDGTQYPVTVIHAAAGGEPSIMATIPVNDEAVRQSVDDLVAVRSAHATTRRADSTTRKVRLRSSPPIDEAVVAREVGQRLFDALISGAVRDAYSSSLAKAREQGLGLRLRLRIETPEAAVLPWEFLYDPQEGDHVALLREIPITRYTALSRDAAPTAKPPLRILAMVAAPSDLATLNVAEEQRRIEQALEHRLERGDVGLHWVEGDTWHDLQTALDRGPWHVFHYIGHGAFDPDSGEGLLAFCDEQGTMQRMSATALGRLFSGHPSLQLAFLNTCEGGRTSDAELFSSVGSVLTRRGVSAVISMQFAISDAAALEFSRLFYDALARGNPVDVAMTAARTGLSIAAPNSIEWATPMLHMRAPDGHLFEMNTGASIFDERKLVPRPHTSAPPPQQPIRDGVASRTTSNQATHGLDILRRKVQQYWIEGVLEHSLFQQTLHDLGMETMGDAVENPWGTHLERAGEPSRALAQDQSIVDVFDENGGLLLLLGEPGSGKTTTLLVLLRTLLQRMESDTEPVAVQSVPVVFNLSSWSRDFPLLENWMADQMSLQYQIPRVASQSLLTAGHILPLLDGLDETSHDARPSCVEAINSYVLERSLTGLVVCCRLKEYIALPVRLALNTAVRLTELSDEQVDAYLAAAGEQLAGLRDLLRRETAMRFDARSPLWLNLMIRAYHNLSVVDLAREGERSAAERRRALMDAYMARMFRRAGGNG
ncbi:CHAT domain-containing protein [Chloroflexi bacterium TSY]|nr:CHAT domain-containing protein [Chloroflexi bacterium TSY]